MRDTSLPSFAFGTMLALCLVATWVTEKGWIVLPESLVRALFFGFALSCVPLHLRCLREGRFSVGLGVSRRDMPRLFWFLVVFYSMAILVLLSATGGEFVQALMRP